MRLPGTEITLSYTEFFDYSLPEILGHPSATWSATFDSSTQPATPFAGTPSSVNQDFILSGLITTSAPELIWATGDISGASPASFELSGTSYLVAPFLPLFPSCTLPCSELANHPNQVVIPSSLFDTTPDTYTGVSAIPEPASYLLIGMGLAGLAGIRSKLTRRIGIIPACSECASLWSTTRKSPLASSMLHGRPQT